MVKRIISFISAVLIVFSISACKKIDGSFTGSKDGNSVVTTQKVTRISNSFKDILPKFKFDSEIAEDYKEGISYTFSAECSKSKFSKYVDKVKDAGFVSKASEAEGYYAAYSDDGYYTEITLVNERITVFIKRK